MQARKPLANEHGTPTRGTERGVIRDKRYHNDGPRTGGQGLTLFKIWEILLAPEPGQGRTDSG